MLGLFRDIDLSSWFGAGVVVVATLLVLAYILVQVERGGGPRS
ncbi:hypothetical protein [Alsobacter ponti]|nr:hypothetical protein [Alsobacter ponti]